MLTPYVHGGLAAGDKCVCIVEAADRAALLAGVRESSDVDIDGARARSWPARALRRRGLLSPRRFLLDRRHGGVLDREPGRRVGEGGYDAVRDAGDTVGVSDVVEQFDEFALYESEVNRLVATYPQTMLCLYDVRRLGGVVLSRCVPIRSSSSAGWRSTTRTTWRPTNTGDSPCPRLGSARPTRSAGRQAPAQGRSTAEVDGLQLESRHDVDHSLHGIFRKLGVNTPDDLCVSWRSGAGRSDHLRRGYPLLVAACRSYAGSKPAVRADENDGEFLRVGQLVGHLIVFSKTPTSSRSLSSSASSNGCSPRAMPRPRAWSTTVSSTTSPTEMYAHRTCRPRLPSLAGAWSGPAPFFRPFR